ncbi:MAG: HIT family hydrolase [Desulfobulbaceae bacterium A2]|nr:MAG: HIT family hydrolase [Desulfobulbaceae bacterium A2]
MKTLWTPWRMEHVLGKYPRPEGCLFEPPGEDPHDAAALLLFRDRETVVLLNRFPYANGHLLVAPRRHCAELTDLAPAEAAALMAMLQQCCAIVQRCFRPHGLNLGLNQGEAAGAGLADHLHFHLIPRWQGDHNFLTPLAELRTIPQHLDATFAQLLPEFKALAEARP